ncbi:uncharacterized protein LOC123674139 [Harmonia axyridis]|uniref:uncharacterized protein LOC123674139 n=1 Tax=Harmonia axyridis TaxID=115357 RepID=UPI001E277ADC|nr:uncharacterized protein LOC123674139 [Harmonia axyridis]
MSVDRFMQDEHEKHFFKFSSSEVYYLIEEAVKKCIIRLMEECKKGVIEENVCSDLALLDKEIGEMEALYMKKCMEVLVEFKEVLRNIFSIPANADIYKKSEKKVYTEEEVKNLREEVVNLQNEFFREKMYLAHLKKEMNAIEALKPSFLRTQKILEELKNETESDNRSKLDRINQKIENCSKKLDLQIKIDESPGLAEDLGL